VSLSSRIFHEVSLRFFLDAIPPGSRVLDCGAGDGAVSVPLARKGCVVDAIDMKAARIDKLNAAKGDLALTGLVGDVLTYPFEPASYDYVISRQFLSRFPDRLWRVLKRKAELCRRGGAVLFHLHSAENVALARELAADPARRAAVERGYSNDAATSHVELEKFCRANSLVLEKMIPLSFFVPSAILFRAFLGEDAIAGYAKEYERRLADPSVYAFASWFESEVVSRMPLALAAAHFAVLRRT
jgi:SAM-dependent methyltransferase